MAGEHRAVETPARHTFAGDRIKSIEVYFGASYKDGKFVKQKAQ